MVCDETGDLKHLSYLSGPALGTVRPDEVIKPYISEQIWFSLLSFKIHKKGIRI